MSHRVLVVDDEPVLRSNLCDLLQQAGYQVVGAADGLEALSRLEAARFDLVVTDIRMPRLDGIGLLKRVVAQYDGTMVLLCTAYASVETAVDALRYGAYDYLLKPVVFEDLLKKVANLLSVGDLQHEVRRLRRDLQTERGTIVGESDAIRRVVELAHKVGPTDSTVLIDGESGTGKELVAREVHRASSLADKPFVAINVGALPEDMMEAQLFGHERGAFTGAIQRKDGLLRAARGGTVFFDEVGELTPAAQVKLLRALDAREILPVGSERPVEVSFRLVAATNRRLECEVEMGRFREDLYYRLNIFRIEVPPLRERREDVPLIADHFARLHAKRVKRPVRAIAPGAMRELIAYGWPGNVRELSNVIERAVILAGADAIDSAHLPAELRDREPLPMALREAVESAERRHIAWVLEVAGGSRDEAARILDIDRATLYRRLQKYDLA